MYRIFTTLTLLACCGCLPRTPRIYNVLISSKKNLSPSHASPVYEPVLRAAPLGYVFPSIVYQTPFGGISPIATPQYITGPTFLPQTAENVAQPQQIEIKLDNQQNANKNINFESTRLQETVVDDGVRPLPVERFIPYTNSFLPNYIQNVAAPGQQKENNFYQEKNNNQPQIAENDDPKQVIANLKKQSDIPDVPPPPLPVKTS